MFNWLTRRSFFVNLLAAIALVFLIGIIFFASLSLITKHGQTIKVPSVTGQNVSQAEKFLGSLGFNVLVRDSAYVDSLAPLAVVRQTPASDYIVKPGRTVYLTVNKTSPPVTAMPNLVNYSFRSAVMTLESQRLSLGDTIYKPDIAKNAVLAQLYHGSSIKAGTLIPEGSKINLVLGDGIGNAANPVPNLVGLTFLQASELLSASNLGMGVVLTDGPITDTSSAFVFRQNPPTTNSQGQNNLIRAGESMDLWLSQQMPVDTSQLSH